MPIVNMKDILQHAYKNQYAVGAFDVVNLDFITGVMDAAEKTQSPVILSLAESHFSYFDFSLLMSAIEAAAKRAAVPVAIHLDHGKSLESAVDSIRYGCNGVMVDASSKALQENINTTKELVEMAHSCGVAVEGELGYVPGVEGEAAERHPGKVNYTTVDDAKIYVKETGVDFLAVSIGTVHGRMQGKPELDFSRLQNINESLNIPLVIHGGTGLDDTQFQTLIKHGVTKINYFTAISDTAANQINENCSTDKKISFTNQVKNVSTAISEEVERCMNLWGSAGKASEVLQSSQPWTPIEHLIIYNVEGLDDSGAKEMATKGKEILAKIPGVREVFIGDSVKEDADYRYTWLVRFCHQAVIDSYREHPDHVAFADNLFRPVAGNRVSIDYQEVKS